MAKIIVVGNEKGGCGKTTLAVNIAAMSVQAGKDTLLIDADSGQHSAAKWAAARHEAHPEAPAVRCVKLTGRTIRRELDDLSSRYEVLVVDTGAEDSPELRAAALVASVLVVPVRPDSLDLWTLPTMELIIEKATSFNPEIRVVIAVNMIPYQAGVAAVHDVKAWVLENVPGLPCGAVFGLMGRAAFGRASGEGLGVAEMPRPDAKAVAEMDSVYREAVR